MKRETVASDPSEEHDSLAIGGMITVWVYPEISHLFVAVSGHYRDNFLYYSSIS